MSKELVISANRHETKVAVLEDDQLVEVYFQRANEYSLAASIHKGRVTRVLPGMQSAFVDLGLERDTFLYVSDFFEENEDIDRITGAEPREERPRDRDRGHYRRPVQHTPPAPVAALPEQGPERGPEQGSEQVMDAVPPATSAAGAGEVSGAAAAGPGTGPAGGDRGDDRGERRGRRSRRRR